MKNTIILIALLVLYALRFGQHYYPFYDIVFVVLGVYLLFSMHESSRIVNLKMKKLKQMITYINHMSYLYAEIRVALIGILINEPQEFLESFKMLTFEDEKQTEKHKTDIKYFEQWLRNY